jgi:hypothetical protein
MIIDDTDASVVSYGTYVSYRSDVTGSFCSGTTTKSTSSAGSLKSVLSELMIEKAQKDYPHLTNSQIEASIDTAVNIIAALHVAKLREVTNYGQVHHDMEVIHRFHIPLQYTSQFVNEYCSYLFSSEADDRRPQVNSDRHRDFMIRHGFHHISRTPSQRSLSSQSPSV